MPRTEGGESPVVGVISVDWAVGASCAALPELGNAVAGGVHDSSDGASSNEPWDRLAVRRSLTGK